MQQKQMVNACILRSGSSAFPSRVIEASQREQPSTCRGSGGMTDRLKDLVSGRSAGPMGKVMTMQNKIAYSRFLHGKKKKNPNQTSVPVLFFLSFFLLHTLHYIAPVRLQVCCTQMSQMYTFIKVFS